MGDVTVHYYSDGKLLKSAPVNAGDYTFSIDVAAGTNYKVITGLTDSSWKFTIAKADAPKINNHYAYYTWAESGEREITVVGLSEDMGTLGTPTCTVYSKVFTDVDGNAETTREALVLAMTSHTESSAVRENEIPATCTADGSYDEVIYCSVCKTQLSREHKTISAAGRKWSDKYESDKTGHWHKCELCGTTTEVESHISSGPATIARAEVCTVCGYQIAPRKKSSGGSVGPGGGPKTPTEDKPAINGVEKGWTEIAAELAGQNGGSVVIALNGETVVPVDVIRAAMNNKIKVEFVVDSVKSWIVDGPKITTATAADLTLLPGSADKGVLRGVPGADLITNGTGIPADLKLKFRKEFAGQFANVYMLTDGIPVFQGCVKADEDGAAVISDAAGEYIVMVCEYSDLSGDMNNDGVLNAIDASAILKDIVGAVAGANPLMADFNGDGVSNALDASAILKYIVGIAA